MREVARPHRLQVGPEGTERPSLHSGNGVASPALVGRVVSELARDERVVLFTTAAHRSADLADWIVPVHGRVFRPPDGRTAKAALALALKTGFGVSPDAFNRAIFDERCGLMLADNRAGRRIVIALAGVDYVLAPTDRNGQFRGTFRVADTAVQAHACDGRLDVAVRVGARDPRQFEGRSLLIPPTGVSVISDIDDTVKVTHVSSRRRMMALTFLETFEAVPGMAQRYRGWAGQGAALHFISSSPWPLYEPLEAFLEAAGFPPFTTSLKNVALKDRSIRNLLAKATKTKPPVIEAMVAAFPGRQFVLIGDSVEKDAEIYAEIARRYPGRIKRILVRDSGGRRTGVERARRALEPLDPVSWQIFEHADELPLVLD